MPIDADDAVAHSHTTRHDTTVRDVDPAHKDTLLLRRGHSTALIRRDQVKTKLVVVSCDLDFVGLDLASRLEMF